MTELSTAPAGDAAGNTAEIGVHVEQLSMSFNGVDVFHDISFDVPTGTTTAIIGPSGGGKSTLLRCINRLETPVAGLVRINDVEYPAGRKLSVREERALHRTVGMVFQHFDLFPHMSVLRNLTFPQRKVLNRSEEQATEVAVRLLERVGLGDRTAARPRELSGGQQQRVAIARALTLDPDILLFDEPTSALDPELGWEVLKVIESLAEAGTTMVVVTHEMSFAEDVADQVVVLAEHTLIEKGRPEQIFSSPSHERTKRFLDHARRV